MTDNQGKTFTTPCEVSVVAKTSERFGLNCGCHQLRRWCSLIVQWPPLTVLHDRGSLNCLIDHEPLVYFNTPENITQDLEASDVRFNPKMLTEEDYLLRLTVHWLNNKVIRLIEKELLSTLCYQ